MSTSGFATTALPIINTHPVSREAYLTSHDNNALSGTDEIS